jgi:hypothetical protein
MAEHAETVEFWKGIVIGTLFGLVAAAHARGDLRRLFTVAANGNSPTDSPKSGFRDHARELDLRREASENAGDPTRLSPVTPAGSESPRAISIERAGGAPGPSSVAEVLEVPGRPGQLIDHSDAAHAVRSAARTHKIIG